MSILRTAWSVSLVLLISGCAENVNDILEEAKKGDPESVKEAVITLGEILSQKEKSGYPYDEGDLAAIDYLRQVAESSQDAANRARALSSLGRLKHPRLTDLYIKCLEDKSSWLLRKEAAEALRQNPDPQAAAPLARQLEAEPRTEVRIPIVKALGAIGGEEALKALLQVFLDRSARFRAMKLATYDALRKLSSKNFEFEDVPSWRKYYEERFPAPKAEEKPLSQREATGARAQEIGAEEPKKESEETPGKHSGRTAEKTAEKAPETRTEKSSEDTTAKDGKAPSSKEK